MNLSYKTTTAAQTASGNPSLRTMHIVIVEDEFLTSTRADEILKFVKDRNPSRHEWKEFKEAVRLGKPLTLKS